MTRTQAVIDVLRRGREEKLAQTVMKIFGVSSLDECLATYESVGRAERAGLDEAIERVTKDASAAFLLGVDAKMSS